MRHAPVMAACPAFKGFLTGLVLSLVGAANAAAQPATIGTAVKVQREVSATQGQTTRALAVEAPVYTRDRLRTGPGARLEARLTDDTVLTLGENGTLLVDEFVYQSTGSAANRLAVRVTQGAFLFVGGRVEDASGRNVAIRTPIGTLGIRGTTVWGGPIDGTYGVLVLNGTVDVVTPRGRVRLRTGEGTTVDRGRVPTAPVVWSAARTARAIAAVSFGGEDAGSAPTPPFITK